MKRTVGFCIYLPPEYEKELGKLNRCSADDMFRHLSRFVDAKPAAP
ncbi:MAG: hypothetical protein ABIV39_00305 [Verrucomicrobiota bacterium]